MESLTLSHVGYRVVRWFDNSKTHCYKYGRHISSRLSSNSQANAFGLLENLEDIFFLLDSEQMTGETFS